MADILIKGNRAAEGGNMNEKTCDTCVWHSWLTGVCYADEPCDNNHSSYTPEDSEWAEESE